MLCFELVGIRGTVSHNLGTIALIVYNFVFLSCDYLCGLVVRAPGYRSRGPGSIRGTARFSDY
jgi:hypothetical protein